MYMCRGTILLKCFTLIIFLQTCNARKSKHYYCPPSACGHIRNIRDPFRLNTDPKDCHFPGYELACEGNQTVMWLFSEKFHVQGIDYDNKTIRLVDPALQTQDDLCSFRPQFNINHYYSIIDSYYYTYDYSKTFLDPIFMFNCPFAVNNTAFVEISGCKLSRYTYLKIGETNASEVNDGCRVQLIGLTSWPTIKDAENNISLSDFHQAILYGFELHYFLWSSRQSISDIEGIFWISLSLLEFFVFKHLHYGRRIRTILSLLLYLMAYLGTKFVIGLPFVIVFLVIKFKRRHLSMYDTIEGFLQTQNNFMPIRYNYSHIKRMTRGFKEKLGEGGYGSVYKGKLQSGRDVAVKMLNKPKAGGQDFMNEVATIGRIHHVNVIGLMGYCVEGTKCALVYDFMPNGSLDKYISTSQEGSPLLSWQRKYDIILGVARGIGYLHRGCDVRILHFDIKPHNILLDENFIPKISDFGLAKLYPTDNSIVTLTAARGTIGYVAPELISRSGYALMDNHAFRPIFHSDTDAIFFTFEAKEDSSLILSLNPDGKLQFLRWNNNATNFWDEVKTLNMAICDQYSICGPYGVCTDGDFPCECPDGFTAASPEEWGKMSFTEGCRRNTSLNYTDKDVFVKNTGLKLPDKATYWGMLYPHDCEQKCLNERSCMAYTNINNNGNGSKCVVWLGDLLDMRHSWIAGNDIFIRMANGKPDAPVSHGKRKLNEGSIPVISVLVLEVLISLSYIVYSHRAKSPEVLDEPEINQPENFIAPENSIGALLQGTDVIAYDSSDLAAATDNFSLSNKIGHGGFGNVYKGVLENGVEIAVKKQDVALRQGVEEFENEVKLIANLQHRNLTKLLGYCIHGIEKFLVYEFMANKSLDKIIFDAARRATVTWPTRLNIIKGIAKGLVYMHHDSRLTIIHRDLKASNVLLDSEMTPKISDFGLAREFEDDVEVKTHRVAGTYGYMSPEYMEDGHYSTKSDVFSFGILTLEIVSGKRNSIYRHPTYDIGLVGYAWKIWNEGNAIELLDPMIAKPDDLDEVLGCILVGILCCQRRSQDRPSMVQVVSLLEENEMLKFNCVPREPYFYKETSHSSRSRESMNGLSITELTGRS